MVGTRDEGCRVEILLRRAEYAGARNLRAPARSPHHPHDFRLGHQGRLLQQSGRRSFLRRVDLALRQPIWRVQLARLVQRRPLSSIRRRQKFHQGQLVLQSQDERRRARPHPIRISAMQRVLHPICERRHGEHHAPRVRRGDVVQVRLRYRHRFDADPFRSRETQRRRSPQRPDEFPESL